jgi:hypothetical protein
MPKSKSFGKEMRVKYALKRKAERESRTDEEQLNRLDQMFDKGKGAAKERARLQKRIIEKFFKNEKRKKNGKRNGYQSKMSKPTNG